MTWHGYGLTAFSKKYYPESTHIKQVYIDSDYHWLIVYTACVIFFRDYRIVYFKLLLWFSCPFVIFILLYNYYSEIFNVSFFMYFTMLCTLLQYFILLISFPFRLWFWVSFYEWKLLFLFSFSKFLCLVRYLFLLTLSNKIDIDIDID